MGSEVIMPHGVGVKKAGDSKERRGWKQGDRRLSRKGDVRMQGY